MLKNKGFVETKEQKRFCTLEVAVQIVYLHVLTVVHARVKCYQQWWQRNNYSNEV